MLKAPFPYFGGKSWVADAVWSALGQPAHYIEPFFGSGAVLLLRTDFDPTEHAETVCDADGHVANVWRAIRSDPDAVAEACDWPVNHADLIARKARLNRETANLLERLCADEKYYHAEMAGYWVWAASCWIGADLICQKRPHRAKRPHTSTGGMGVHAKGRRPHISDGGMGVHAKGRRPHISEGGRNENIYNWMRELAKRLRYVRVVCGDWTRVCGGNWQTNAGTCGIFFDPPYSDAANRHEKLYSTDSLSVAHDVREWCLHRGDDPEMRIVLAGYYEEHEELLTEGWSVERWSAQGGYASLGRNGPTNGQRNRHREALFFSPHCVKSIEEETLFGVETRRIR